MLLALWLVVVFGGGFFWLFPLKLRILKRHGMSLSNRQIAALADAGEADAIRLRRSQRIFLVAAGIASLLLVGVPLLSRS
jgi:hypothetical protein